MSTHDILFDMADKACVRAWEQEGWGPFHRRLLTMCIKIDHPGKKKNMNGPKAVVLNHLRKTNSISIREAMDDYNISGGHLTKIISRLKKEGIKVDRQFCKHPVTGRRYARYALAA